MSLVVVGSFGIDTVQTPQATREEIMGGSAVFFSYAASYFGPVQVAGVVGGDWPAGHTEVLARQGVDTQGIEVRQDAQTFRWTGKYMENMNDRETLDVQLNVLGDFDPDLPESYRTAKYVFLANGAIDTQRKVIKQCPDAVLTVADTMDLWIKIDRENLLAMLREIDGLVLNDSEALLLTGHQNVIQAGRDILEMGPQFVVIKKGEHGALYIADNAVFSLPAYPTPDVKDPTGAGDSFAGGMMGYLASIGAEPVDGHMDANVMKKAIAYGTIVASFNVEDFSLDRMQQIDREKLDQRLAEYRDMLTF